VKPLFRDYRFVAWKNYQKEKGYNAENELWVFYG